MSRLSAAFMGSPEFAVPCLEATARRCDVVSVVTQPDRPAGRGRKLAAPAVKIAAETLGLPVLQPVKVRDGTLEQALRASALDVIIVVAYGRILPPGILTAARYGCINVHGSLLPRWRGAAPIQRAVLAGDAESGLSIMQMDEGCDTGPVFETRATPIGPYETSGELFTRLSALAGAHLDDFLSRFPDVPPATPQPSDGVMHAAKLEKSEGEVDWNRPTREVTRHICGMDPWPGAFTSRAGQPLKIFGVRRSEREATSPGEVVAVDGDGMHVSCEGGCVLVSEVQPAGKRRMAAQAYVAGRPFSAGERLGVTHP